MLTGTSSKRRGVVVDSKAAGAAESKHPVPLLHGILSSFGLDDDVDLVSRFEQLPDVILRRLFAFLTLHETALVNHTSKRAFVVERRSPPPADLVMQFALSIPDAEADRKAMMRWLALSNRRVTSLVIVDAPAAADDGDDADDAADAINLTDSLPDLATTLSNVTAIKGPLSVCQALITAWAARLEALTVKSADADQIDDRDVDTLLTTPLPRLRRLALLEYVLDTNMTMRYAAQGQYDGCLAGVTDLDLCVEVNATTKGLAFASRLTQLAALKVSFDENKALESVALRVLIESLAALRSTLTSLTVVVDCDLADLDQDQGAPVRILKRLAVLDGLQRLVIEGFPLDWSPLQLRRCLLEHKALTDFQIEAGDLERMPLQDALVASMDLSPQLVKFDLGLLYDSTCSSAVLGEWIARHPRCSNGCIELWQDCTITVATAEDAKGLAQVLRHWHGPEDILKLEFKGDSIGSGGSDMGDSLVLVDAAVRGLTVSEEIDVCATVSCSAAFATTMFASRVFAGINFGSKTTWTITAPAQTFTDAVIRRMVLSDRCEFRLVCASDDSALTTATPQAFVIPVGHETKTNARRVDLSEFSLPHWQTADLVSVVDALSMLPCSCRVRLAVPKLVAAGTQRLRPKSGLEGLSESLSGLTVVAVSSRM
jgi:hypothetical protein